MSRLVERVRRLAGSQAARWAGVGVAGLTAVAVAVPFAVSAITGLPDDAAFRIGHTVVTEAELADRVRAISALYGVQRPDDPAGEDRYTRDTAKAVAVSLVLERAATDHGVVIGEKVVSDRLDQLVAQTAPAGRDEFVARLGEIGLSERAVREEIRRQLANGRLYEQITRDVPAVTDEDLRQAYQERRAALVKPEQRRLRNIVLGTDGEAREVLDLLAAGDDFATVAARWSLDQSTSAAGGDLGAVTRDQLEPGYREAAYQAPPGALFGPVQTRYGWNVGQVLAVIPAVPLDFKQVGEQLRAQVYTERKLRRWNSWLAELIRAADVEYAPRYQPADPETPPADPPR